MRKLHAILLSGALGLVACGGDTAPPPAEGTAGAAAPAAVTPPIQGASAAAGSVDSSGAVTFAFQPAAKDAQYKVEETEEITAGDKTKVRERALGVKVLEQSDGTVSKLQVDVERATQGAKGEAGKVLLPAGGSFTLSARQGGPSEVSGSDGKPVEDSAATLLRASVRGFKRLGGFAMSLPKEALKPGTSLDLPGEALRGMLGEGEEKLQFSSARVTLKQVEGAAPQQRAVFDVTAQVKGKREGVELDGALTGTVQLDVASGVVVQRDLQAEGLVEGKKAKLSVTAKLSFVGGAPAEGAAAAAPGAPPAGTPVGQGAPPAGTPPAAGNPPAGTPETAGGAPSGATSAAAPATGNAPSAPPAGQK